MNPKPPRIFLRFFQWFCHPKIARYIEGDLIEVYQRRYRTSGKRAADLRFIIDVIFLLRPGIVRPVSYQPTNTYGMYGNYFKTAFRNLWKNKGYSAINILGLAIGMSVALLIGLWIKFQVSYDTFHENRDNIAIVMKKAMYNDYKGVQTGVQLPLYGELKASFPEIKNVTRVDWGGGHGLIVNDTRISKRGHFVDPGFLEMFTFPMVKGNINTALNDPYSIVITESLAKDLFGDTEPMGKMVTIDKSSEMIVTGVIRDVPPNSTIVFDFLAPYEWQVLNREWIKASRDDWNNNFLQTYVELNQGVTARQFSARIENLQRTKTGNADDSQYFVHPLTRIHLYNKFENWENAGGAIEIVRLFGIVGLLVLSIACINFVNLSTARSEKRAPEVGVRKAIGSHRGQLVVQFLSESFLTTVISFVMSLLIVYISLPWLSPLGFENIAIDLTDPGLVGLMIAAIVLTSVVAGWYPALYLSAVKTVSVLKGSMQTGKAANLPRKVLVVSQFTFSIALIIATSVIFRQIQYAKGRPLGYNPKDLMHIYLTADLQDHFDAMKEQLLSTGIVESVSRSSSPMTSINNTWGGFSWEGMDPELQPMLAAIMVSYDFDKTSGLTMKEGRFFDREHVADSTSIILNEAAAKLVGFNEPLGRTIKLNNTSLTVIGLNNNIVMDNPYEEVIPTAMFLWPGRTDVGSIRLREGVTPQKAIEVIQPLIEKLNPAFPFEYSFVEDTYVGKFANENKLGTLSAIFASISILISCLGLFGLASFMAERRTKEIGIRKVVGASVFNLWRMLSRDFVVLVIIACLVAIPASYIIMAKWLTGFNYRTDIPLWLPIVTGVAALAITLITVSYQTIRAAKMNPVKSLRSE